MRLIDAHLLDREHGIEQRTKPGCVDRCIEHHRRAVRQDRSMQPRCFQASEHIGDFGKCIKGQVEVHQPIAQACQAVIAIENVRLFDEVQARTRELSEALEQQTATSEVLQVISSSPGTLQPVCRSMLENATSICEADLCRMAMYENGAFRHVAL